MPISSNYIYKSNFNVHLTNIKELEKAQVICIPESHNDTNCQLRQAWLINKIYSDKYLVLVESPNLDESQSYFQTSYVPCSIDVAGWDDMDSDQKLHKAKEPFYQLFSAATKDPREVFDLLKVKIEEAPGTENFKAGLRLQLKNAMEQPANTKMQKLFTYLVIRHLQMNDEINGKISEVHKKTFPIRQKSMIERCEAACLEGKKVIIIAGAGHLLIDNDVDENKEFNDIKNQAVQSLHDYLKTKEFIIFDHEYPQQVSPELKAELRKEKIIHVVKRIFCIFVSVILFPLSLPAGIITAVFYPEKFKHINLWLGRPFRMPAF